MSDIMTNQAREGYMLFIGGGKFGMMANSVSNIEFSSQ